LRVRVRKGTFRTRMNTHKWRIRVFCLLANRRGLAGSSTTLKEKVGEFRKSRELFLQPL